ncbi:Superoxide dismutase [Fe] [Madurella mycetomatis]|uniref:Superoxide dismutase [Fe] n=1 Tax=Madurella mycetomatis TaxID=100816 RepID=A0A175W200_9PEZI|nr:Superoxide dismutase [Fe] [Madurella mycetomatis]
MFRPRLRIPRPPRLGVSVQSRLLPLACQTRSQHTLRPLEYPTDQGIPGFLSAASLNISWTQYQTFLLQKLNALIAGIDIKDIALLTARDPEFAPTFNYASMAHNNQFFFQHLTPKPVEMPALLRGHLEQSFGSIETLRNEMIYTADAMFGPGFVWLVKVSTPFMPVSFKVLTTYLAGSPYPAAHWRRQDVDMNTKSGSWNEAAIETGKKYLDNSAFGAGKRSPEATKRLSFAPGGTDLVPVLCLNTWEHVWLWDYGFGVGQSGGKLAYAQAWWKSIDWDKVCKEANISRQEMLGSSAAAV